MQGRHLVTHRPSGGDRMSDFNEGDLVEAVKGETSIRGQLWRDSAGFLMVGASVWAVEDLIHEEWGITVAKKATPPLPDDPGAVISWVTKFYTGLAVLEKTDQWCYNGVTLNGAALRQEIGEASIVPLESVPVTAKRVLDRLANFWEFGPPKNFQEEFAQIATEFGVTAL